MALIGIGEARTDAEALPADAFLAGLLEQRTALFADRIRNLRGHLLRTRWGRRP